MSGAMVRGASYESGIARACLNSKRGQTRGQACGDSRPAPRCLKPPQTTDEHRLKASSSQHLSISACTAGVSLPPGTHKSVVAPALTHPHTAPPGVPRCSVPGCVGSALPRQPRWRSPPHAGSSSAGARCPAGGKGAGVRRERRCSCETQGWGAWPRGTEEIWLDAYSSMYIALPGKNASSSTDAALGLLDRRPHNSSLGSHKQNPCLWQFCSLAVTAACPCTASKSIHSLIIKRIWVHVCVCASVTRPAPL